MPTQSIPGPAGRRPIFTLLGRRAGEAARLSAEASNKDASVALPKWTAALAAAQRAEAAVAAGEANEELTAQVEQSVANYERKAAKARKAFDLAEKNTVMLGTL